MEPNQDIKSSPEDPVYSRKVLEMITVANEFCLFLEKAEDYSKEELFGFLQKIGPLIYLKAALLPEITPEDDGAVEHYVTEEQWELMFNLLRTKFGDDDIFYYIDNHEKSHNDPLRGSLAEHFTDVYQDMKDFVMLYQKPIRSFKENAVNDCRNLFADRFGIRLVNAQAALHYILYKQAPGDEFYE
jgi:hypothetical protein